MLRMFGLGEGVASGERSVIGWGKADEGAAESGDVSQVSHVQILKRRSTKSSLTSTSVLYHPFEITCGNYPWKANHQWTC